MRFPLDYDHWEDVVSGCDEVGRGCMAGPVVVACVSWRPRDVHEMPWFTMLRDSKQTTAAQRQSLFFEIMGHAERVRVAVIPHYVVDQINVLRASLLGFELTAPAFSENALLFLDGNQRPPSLGWARTLVKGENRLSAIAAASILAKVIRDEWMQAIAAVFPGYGFQAHVGYPTAQHKLALAEHGPCPIHRKSYKPLAPFAVETSKRPDLVETICGASNDSESGMLASTYLEHYFEFSARDDGRVIRRLARSGGLWWPFGDGNQEGA